MGGTAKRPTGAWGWSAEPSTPKLEDSLGGATRRSLHISEYLRILKSQGNCLIRRKFIRICVVILACCSMGCRKSPVDLDGSTGGYDPRKDPRVNPPTLFDPPPQNPKRIASDETLTIALPKNPLTLNPLFVSSPSEFAIINLISKPLFLPDQHLQWTRNETMVQTFQESEDHTQCTVTLKKNLHWHDGHPLTAQDVVFSYQQILDPAVPAFGQRRSILPITECIALDDHTIKYVQPNPQANRRWNLIFPILPRHIFTQDKQNHPDLQTGDYFQKLSRSPMGNGPYKLTRWQPNQFIELERWEDYYGPKPHFQRIIFRIIPEESTALQYFQMQKVDVIDWISMPKFTRPTGNKLWQTRWRFRYLGWNQDGSNPFFTDRRVRYAMTHALNTPLIREKVYYNLGSPCLGIYHPDSWMFNPAVKPIAYNPSQAAALLDDAGWKPDPQTGWRCKQSDGKNIPFTFTLLVPQSPDYLARIALIYQQDLKKLGIQMKIQILEWSVFLEMIRRHRFEAMINMWNPGPDPDLDENVWCSTGRQKGRNYIGYSHPQIDTLYQKGRYEFDPDKRKKIFQEVHQILWLDQPYTWIAHEPLLALIHPRIRGLQAGPMGVFNLTPGLESWWTPACRGDPMWSP
jgi:peptide/nickel transport system substrate-binding protein